MKCFHRGYSFAHRLLIFLTQGDWNPTKLSLLHNLVRLSPPREDYQLSLTTLGDYCPLGRITTSLLLPWGLYPAREDNHLSLTSLGDYYPLERIITSSLATLGDCYPLISPNITLGDYQPRHKVTCRSFLKYFIRYPFSINYSD